MISVAEAQAKIATLLTPLATETIPTQTAFGRVLREDAVATRAQPPFPASAMDGYAITRGDKASGTTLQVTGEVAAGQHAEGTVSPGQAMRIFTGAPVPTGADTILIQEDADRQGDTITIRDDFDIADYIRPAGGDFDVGHRLIAPRRLTYPDLSLLAAMNIPMVTVTRQPVVAIIPTGNELVWPGETPRVDQIVASNHFGLKAMLEAEGAIARLTPIAKDTREDLLQVLTLAQSADLIVTLGGASVGDHDLVQSVAKDAGLDLSFYKLAMRPGKPLMAGLFNGVPMIGLPGNPVSSLVCGEVFLRPAIPALSGLPYTPRPTQTALLKRDIGPNGPRTHYMRAKLSIEDGNAMVDPATRQDSSLLTVLSSANGLMVRAPNDPARQKGEPVDVMPL